MNTKQQEFDAVVAHLYKQGRPAKLPGTEKCFYRDTLSGCTCAVGCRIPDENYSPEMEQLNIFAAIDKAVGNLPPEIYEYRFMFSALQNAHDRCATKADGTFNFNALAKELRRVAKLHDVIFTVPKGA